MKRPKIGNRVKFDVWEDTEHLGKYYTDLGDGTERPDNYDEWTGEVIKIGEPNKYNYSKKKKNSTAVNTYWIKRDFDGFVQLLESKNIIDYVN